MNKSRNREHIYNHRKLGGLIADKVTAFSGSWAFLLIHFVWFSLWIGLRVEPFPFGLLTMIVSLEAIILAALVLMSQNRQQDRDRARDDHEAEEVDELFTIQVEQLEILKRLARIEAEIKDK